MVLQLSLLDRSRLATLIPIQGTLKDMRMYREILKELEASEEEKRVFREAEEAIKKQKREESEKRLQEEIEAAKTNTELPPIPKVESPDNSLEKSMELRKDFELKEETYKYFSNLLVSINERQVVTEEILDLYDIFNLQ